MKNNSQNESFQFQSKKIEYCELECNNLYFLTETGSRKNEMDRILYKRRLVWYPKLKKKEKDKNIKFCYGEKSQKVHA